MPSALRPYEVMIILDADLEEETIRAAVERWLQLIESRGAERGHVDLWGKRRLAYEIKHKHRGLLRGLSGPVGARGDGRVAPGALPCRRSHPPQGAAHPGEGLRTSEGRRHRGGALREDSMANNTNNITVVGNMTRDPEMRYTPSGSSNVTFGVAVNRSWRNQQTNEWEERTSFFNVVCWRQLAENVARVAHEGLARRRHRPARAAQLGDRPGREALGRRDRRRRRRSEPRVRDRRGAPRRAQRPGRRRWRRAAAATSPPASRRRRPTTSDLRRRTVLMAQRRNDEEGRLGEGPAPDQEEDVDPHDREHRVDRLQGRQPAAAVHVGAREDPRPPGHRQRPEAAGRGRAAIKLAREMALLPYSVRQVTQRSKGRRDRGDRGDRDDARSRRSTASRCRRRPRNVERRTSMAENDEFDDAGIDETVDVEAGAE